MCPAIYQYIRNLRGIVDVLYQPRERMEDPPPSLGALADSYLDAHGYGSASIFYIHGAYEQCDNIEDFADELCTLGMARKEAWWLWEIISNGNLHVQSK
jgi:hypothetical protein